MAETTFQQLRKKEVINICDGSRLGCICDLDIEICEGRINAIIVPGESSMFGILRSKEELVIPYCRINKIGDDVILVEVNTPT
jgi:YlmC/YmxH family sporulation protein